MRHSAPACAAILAMVTACQPANESQNDDSDPSKTALASAIMQTSADEPAGIVNLIDQGGQLVLNIDLVSIPEGTSGFHLHTVGLCEEPDFKSAGGHLNPGGNEHGTENPQGSHLGDLPNLVIGPDGTVRTEVSVGASSDASLAAIFDEDGTAVMLHAGPDDYVSDPAGNAGPRIACGVLERNISN